MTSVLITAFEPYDRWAANASWLALVELTRDLPGEPAVTTRRYPVDFAAARERLAVDLRADYDFAIHLGQAPGSPRIRLEALAVNVGVVPGDGDRFETLIDDGPAAYRTPLPVTEWAAMLRSNGIPAEVSFHAGTYLCNAILYYSHYMAERMRLKTRSAFVHLPLDTSQAAELSEPLSSLSASSSAAALRMILANLATHQSPTPNP